MNYCKADFKTSIDRDVKSNKMRLLVYPISHAKSHELVTTVTKEDGIHTTSSMESANASLPSSTPILSLISCSTLT